MRNNGSCLDDYLHIQLQFGVKSVTEVIVKHYEIMKHLLVVDESYAFNQKKLYDDSINRTMVYFHTYQKK